MILEQRLWKKESQMKIKKEREIVKERSRKKDFERESKRLKERACREVESQFWPFSPFLRWKTKCIMDRQKDQRTDQWTNGGMDWQMDQPMDSWTNRRTDGRTDRWTYHLIEMIGWIWKCISGPRTDGPMDGRTNGQTNRPIDGHTDELMDRLTD